MSSYSGIKLAAKVESDGYFVVDNYFPAGEVGVVKKELEAILDEDLEFRENNNIKSRRFSEDGALYSSETATIHSVVHSLWKSPGLKKMFEKIFSDPEIKIFTDKVIGENFRIRADIVRRASGIDDTVDDFQIPHQWHRDSSGEFAFGIFFDDFSKELSGGTGVIKGTHWKGYKPQFDFVLSKNSVAGEKYVSERERSLKFLNPTIEKYCFFNAKYKNTLADEVEEIKGPAGSLYFFLNETWHGRMPNIHGGKNMLVRFGGFASEFPFKEDRPLPGDITELPISVAKHYDSFQEINRDPDTVLQRMRSKQANDFGRLNLPKLAYAEKHLARMLSHTLRRKKS